MMAGYLAARTLCGLVGANRGSTVDLISLFLAYVAGQGLIAAALTRIFPGG